MPEVGIAYGEGDVMKLTERQRIAIFRILIDMTGDIDYLKLPHFQSLKEKAGLTDKDLQLAKDENLSVLSSLVILKEVHYTVKMLLGLTVSDLYLEKTIVELQDRIAFETMKPDRINSLAF